MRADKKMGGIDKFLKMSGSASAKKDFEALADGKKQVSTEKLKDKLEDRLKGLKGQDKQAFKAELDRAFDAHADGKMIKVKDAQALYRSVKRRAQAAQAFSGEGYLNSKLDSSQVKRRIMSVLKDRNYVKDFDPNSKKFQKQLDMVLDKVKGKDLSFSEFNKTLFEARRAANDVFELGGEKDMKKDMKKDMEMDKKMEKMK